MTEKRYHAVGEWFRARPRALGLLAAANRILPLADYVLYLGSLVLLALGRDARFWRALFVPAMVFLLGTLVRAALNCPRPYEVYKTAPLTPKDVCGKSFPSRHLFSAAVIAVCGFWLWPPLGWIQALVALLLAPARVLAGVHFVRDVSAGALLGALLGWLGFFVL